MIKVAPLMEAFESAWCQALDRRQIWADTFCCVPQVHTVAQERTELLMPKVEDLWESEKLREPSWMSSASTSTGGSRDFVSEQAIGDFDDVPTIGNAFLDVGRLEEVVAFIAYGFPDVSELEAAVDYHPSQQSCSTTEEAVAFIANGFPDVSKLEAAVDYHLTRQSSPAARQSCSNTVLQSCSTTVLQLTLCRQQSCSTTDEKPECSDDVRICSSTSGATSDCSDDVRTANTKLIIKSWSTPEFQLSSCSGQMQRQLSARLPPSQHHSAVFQVAQFKLRTCQQELSQLRLCESYTSEEVLKVSSRLVDLSMDLLEYAYRRDMPGSMELFGETMETIDEAAFMMRGFSHGVPMIADIPKEQSFPNTIQIE